MVAMEASYSRAHPGISLQSTILTWGNPYYTKLSLAIRSGSPPDVAIMHLSRISEFGPPGMLTPLSLDLLAAHGMEPKDFTPLAFSKAHFNGQLLAIPLDTHPFVQYYNTRLCRKAGLLDSSGQLPPIRGGQAMLAVLRKLKKLGATPAVCDQVDDPATAWRLFYTLYSQAGGQVLADNGRRVVLDEALATRVLTFIYQLATEGLLNANVDANGGAALFQAGDAGLYWEGEWKVDVFQSAGLPFSMQPFPALFGSDVAQADSHTSPSALLRDRGQPNQARPVVFPAGVLPAVHLAVRGRRADLDLAVRTGLRVGRRVLPSARVRRPGLAVIPGRGAILRRHRHRVVDARLQLRALPGRPAGHPA